MMVRATVASRCYRLLLSIIAMIIVLLLAWSVAGCGNETATSSLPPDATALNATTTIADGTYFGFVTEIGEDYVLVDFAEYFSDEEAQQAALADGAIDSADELPNPFYIRNPDETTVRLEVRPGTLFLVILDPGTMATADRSIEQLARLAAGESDGYQYYAGLPGQPGPGGLPMELGIAEGRLTGGSQVYIP